MALLRRPLARGPLTLEPVLDICRVIGKSRARRCIVSRDPFFSRRRCLVLRVTNPWMPAFPQSGGSGSPPNSEARIHELLPTLRQRASARQQHRCYYCNLPMWQDNADKFSVRHGISCRMARQFQCTAEHLIPRSAGGRTTRTNIVAACLHCNQTRSRKRRPPDPAQWRSIQGRRASRRWSCGGCPVPVPSWDVGVACPKALTLISSRQEIRVAGSNWYHTVIPLR